MTARRIEAPAWSRRRWGVAVILAVAVQVTLVLWLGDRSPVERPTAPDPFRVLLVPQLRGEPAELYDPTLFVWANPHGFSGRAWMDLPPPEFRPPRWTEPPLYLPLPTTGLGDMVRVLIASNAAGLFPVPPGPKAVVPLPDIPLTAALLPTQSVMRVNEELAARRPLTSVALPSWPYADVLTNSVVQVQVDADGWVESARLMASSGLAEADQCALDVAKAARFASVRRSGPRPSAPLLPGLTSGDLVFFWHTVPPAATNAPPSAP